MRRSLCPGVLRLGLSCVEAYAVSLAEVRIEPLTLTDAALDLTLRSKEVLTLEFVLGEEVTMPRCATLGAVLC